VSGSQLLSNKNTVKGTAKPLKEIREIEGY